MNDLTRIDRWWILVGHVDDLSALDWRSTTTGVGLVILNDDRRIPIHEIAPETVRLAYLSVGEAEMTRAYWPSIASLSLLVERNPDWADNVRVDLRDRRWHEVLLDQEVPRLLGLGFHGLMLDTIDTAPYLEAKDPVRFAGCRQALRDLLAALRKAFPDVVLVANGTEALVDAAPYVDGYVTEGLFATYDLAPGSYRPTTTAERSWRLARVENALRRARRPVFSVEYAAPGDESLAAWARQQAERHGFKPFVTVRNLNQLPQ